MNIGILIISLSPDRFHNVSERVRSICCDFPIIHVPGIVPTDSELSKYHRTIPKSQIGCFLAHLSAWSVCLSSTHDSFLILEDDVYFTGNFVDSLLISNTTLSTYDMYVLGNLIAGKHVSDILLHEQLIHLVGSGRLCTGKDGLYKVGHLYGTHAYMINKKGAEKLRSLLPEPVGHIDMCITQCIKKGLLNVVGLRPSTVYQGDFSTSSQSTCSGNSKMIDEPPIGWMLGAKQLRVPAHEFTTMDIIGILLVVIIIVVAFIMYLRCSSKG